jgi:16S rRNA (guanine(1405)-N(7))-methyltransferase
MTRQIDINQQVEKIASSRKYRHSGIPRQTIEDILRQEQMCFSGHAEALKSAKAILHNVMAPYLGDPDYEAEEKNLAAISAGKDAGAISGLCMEILSRHDSTRERLPYQVDFYKTIRDIAPKMRVVMDLASGLNPFALPFMELPPQTQYHAYDIHQPRVDLINHFFIYLGLEPLAEIRDVLLDPPLIRADAAFLFKEAHRMEKRRKGCSRELIKILKARVIFISLPNRSLDGKRDLHQRMEVLFQQISAGLGGITGSHEFPGETLYWIKNNDG